jgi:hypothetical protein
MNHLRKICSLIILSIFISCSTSSNYFIAPEYKGKNFSKVKGLGVSLLVVPVYRDQFYGTKKPLFGSLNSQQKEIFHQTVNDFFLKNFSAKVDFYDFLEPFGEDSFDTEQVTIENAEYFVLKPQNNLFNNHRFVLFIDEFVFSKQFQAVDNSTYGGHEITNRSLLYFETKYSVWDNENNKIAAYGVFNTRKELNSEPQKNDYVNVINKVFKQIAEKMPFKSI